MKKPNFIQRTLRRMVGKSFDLDSMFLTGQEMPYSNLSGGGVGGAYKSSATAYACMRRQAVDISSVPLLFLRDPDDMNSGMTTPIQGLFEQPNGWTSQEQFLQQIVIMALLRGDMMAVFDDAQSPTKMYSHYDSNNWSEIIDTKTDNLVGWHYQKEHRDFVKLPSEILFHRLPSPYDPYRGQAPLTAAVDSMNIARQTDSVHSSITARGGESGIVYKTAQELTGDQHDQLLGRLQNRHRGTGQTPNDILLHGGLEIIPPSFTKADVELLTLRQPAVETICQVYGMSPTLIGQANESNYSTFRGYMKIYWLQTLLPFLRGLENSFDKYFANRHGVYVRFDIRAIDALQDYLSERKDTAKTFYQMGVPMVELNRRLNLGFDVNNVIASEDCLMPVNMAPMSVLAEGEHIAILAGSNDSNQQPPAKAIKQNSEVTPSEIPIHKTGIPSESQQQTIEPVGESLPILPLDRVKHPSISIPCNRRIAGVSKKYKGLLRRELLNQKSNGYNQEKLDDIVGQFASRVMLEGCIKALVCVSDKDVTDATWDELKSAVTITDIDKWQGLFPDIVNNLVDSQVDTLDDKARKDTYNKVINGTNAYLNELADMVSETGFQLQLLDLGIDIEKE